MILGALQEAPLDEVQLTELNKCLRMLENSANNFFSLQDFFNAIGFEHEHVETIKEIPGSYLDKRTPWYRPKSLDGERFYSRGKSSVFTVNLLPVLISKKGDICLPHAWERLDEGPVLLQLSPDNTEKVIANFILEKGRSKKFECKIESQDGLTFIAESFCFLRLGVKPSTLKLLSAERSSASNSVATSDSQQPTEAVSAAPLPVPAIAVGSLKPRDAGFFARFFCSCCGKNKSKETASLTKNSSASMTYGSAESPDM